jgi:hypothetical protein
MHPPVIIETPKNRKEPIETDLIALFFSLKHIEQIETHMMTSDNIATGGLVLMNSVITE